MRALAQLAVAVAVIAACAMGGCCPCLYCGSGGFPDVSAPNLSPPELTLPVQATTTSQVH